MNKKESMETLVFKYLSGQVTEEEQRTIDDWIGESYENREMFNEIKMIWDHSKSRPFEMDEKEMLHEQQRFRLAMAERKLHDLDWTLSGMKKSRRYKNIAIIFFSIATSLLLYVSLSLHNIGSGEITIPQNSNILLPDSSEVFTHKESSVSFRQTFWKREAQLEGEAFFEVHRSERRPFWIYAGNATIKVLGTSFLVEAYPGEPLKVLVVSGTVKVGQRGREVQLQEGELVVVTGEGNMDKRNNVNPNLLSWKTGTLTFNNAGLMEVLGALENLHGITFEVSDPKITNCSFLGTIDNLSLENAVKLLTDTYGFSSEYVSPTRIRLFYNEPHQP